jgi:2,4-dienoyl-CoA reductase (NADPH2)
MIKPGEAKLPKLFEPAQWGRFQIKNRIKYGACCVSNYNGRSWTIPAMLPLENPCCAG